jgi:hypothetical protein
MLNFAMVLMILAGLFGLPAAACSSACAGIGAAAGAANDPSAAGGQAIMEGLMWLSILASIGSIIVGALIKKLGKMVSGIAALLFCGIFAILILQMNIFGILSSLMLLIAAVMIFVAPTEQFRNVTKVEMNR